MTSFNYGAKGVSDVDPTCRCHQSNIMPDSILSVNIAWCVVCGYICYCCVLHVCVCVCVCMCVCVCVCVCLGVIFLAPFIRRDKVPSFLTITLAGLGKPQAIAD